MSIFTEESWKTRKFISTKGKPFPWQLQNYPLRELPTFEESLIFQNSKITLHFKSSCTIPWDGALTHIHTEQTADSSRFIFSPWFWPALGQPWQGSGAWVMCSALHAGGSSLLSLPPEGRSACRVTEATALCLDCRSFSYGKEAAAPVKAGLRPKWMQLPTLRCAGRSFRQRLHRGSLSLAGVSVRSSYNSWYSRTDAGTDHPTLLRETCTLKCEWPSPDSTKSQW